MAEFLYTIEHIPFAEFDLGGVLYHANYLRLYEQAREAFLRSVALPYQELMAEGSHLVVAEVGLQYKKPIHYGEPLTIALTISEMKRVSVKIQYELRTPAGIVNTGFTTLVFVRMSESGFRPDMIPERLLPAFEAISVAVPSAPR